MQAAEEQVLIRSQSVVARVVGGQTLIVPIRGKVGDLGSIYRLNAPGSLMWKLLERPASIRELIAAVANEFDVNPDAADHDVREFIREMEKVGLVESPTTVISKERPVGREEDVSPNCEISFVVSQEGDCRS